MQYDVFNEYMTKHAFDTPPDGMLTILPSGGIIIYIAVIFE